MMKPAAVFLVCLLALNSARAMPVAEGEQKESLSVVPLEKIKEAVPVPPVAEEKSGTVVEHPVALPDHEQVRSAVPEEPKVTPVPEKKDETKPAEKSVEPIKAEEKVAVAKPDEKPEIPKEEQPKKEEKELKVEATEVHHHHDVEVKPTVGDVVAEHKSEKEAVHHEHAPLAPVASVAGSEQHHHEHVSPVGAVAEHVQHVEPKSAEEQPILVEKKAEPVATVAEEPIAQPAPVEKTLEEKIDSRVVRGTEDVVAAAVPVVAQEQSVQQQQPQQVPVEAVQTAEAKSIVEPLAANSAVPVGEKPVETPAQIIAEENVKTIANEQQPKIEAALAEESKPQETPKVPETPQPTAPQETPIAAPTELAKEQARSDVTGEEHHQHHHQQPQQHETPAAEVKVAELPAAKIESKSEQLPKPEQVMKEEPIAPLVPVLPKEAVVVPETLLPQKDEEAKPQAEVVLKKKEAKKQEQQENSSAEESSEEKKDGEKKLGVKELLANKSEESSEESKESKEQKKPESSPETPALTSKSS